MARSRTLALLRADVRERADMVGSTFITDATLNEYINQSAARCQNKFTASRGHSYQSSSTTWTTTSSLTYALPSDFFESQLVMISSGGSNQEMRPFEMHEYPRWSERAPTAGYTVTMIYTPVLARMTSDSDTFDGVNGWEEWIVLDAAIKALNKEESDVSVLMAQRGDVEAEITSMAGDRDGAWPSRIVDVDRRAEEYAFMPVPRFRIMGANLCVLWGPVTGWEFT